MATTPIIELFINDDFDESGIEAISLVSRPAHEETWVKQEEQKMVSKQDLTKFVEIETQEMAHNLNSKQNQKFKTL